MPFDVGENNKIKNIFLLLNNVHMLCTERDRKSIFNRPYANSVNILLVILLPCLKW